MVTDLIQRRIPKRKDRFDLVYGIWIIVLALPILDLLLPNIHLISGEDSWFIFYFVLVMLALLGVNLYKWRTWHNTWGDFASEMGLSCVGYKPNQFSFLEWPRIEGSYQGYDLLIKRFTRGSGKYKKIYTSVNIDLRNQVSESLGIMPRKWTLGIRKWLPLANNAALDVHLGDDLFDRKFVLTSSAEHFARNVLSSYGLKQGLVEIKRQAKDFKLDVQGSGIYYQEQSSILDKDYLSALINTFIELAGYVERYG